jgi:hypothetical protein
VLWSLYTSGSPLPANQVGRRYLAWGSALKLDGRIIWPAYLEEAISNIPDLLELVSMAMGSVFVAGLAFLGRTTSVHQTRFQRLVGLYLILYFGTLVFYQGYFPNVHGLRYLNLPVHLVCILAAAFLSHLIDMNKIARGSKQLLFVGCLGALIWSAAYQYSELADDFDWVEDDGVLSRYDSEAVHSYWAFIDWLNLNLPPGTVVAAKDHGRLAYFTDLQVVDLAGILEPSLLTYMHEDRVSTFLAERQAAYVVMPPDRGKTIHEMIREQLTLEEIDTPAQELTDYRLYRSAAR